jgi:hypothetical protein
MTRRIACTLVLLLALPTMLAAEGSAARRAAEGARYRAARFDVAAVLDRDRSLRIEETVVFDLHEGTFTSVWRDIPSRRTDGIDAIAATMDGIRLPPGRDPGHVEIRTGSDVRVTWHFLPTSGPHVFGLTYRLRGVATTTPDQTDALAWIALPSKHAYAIDRARVTLQWPAGLNVLGHPRISAAEARVTLDPSGPLTVEAQDLRPDRTLRLDLLFPAGTLSSTPPSWQARDAERRRRGPWLLLVAAAILAAGLAWLAVFRSAWPRQRGGTMTTVKVPPDPQRPAAVAARLAGHTARMPLVMTTLVELASRGVITVEERPRAARLLGRGFGVRLERDPSALAAHEAALVALVFGRHPGRGREVSWRRLAQVVSTRGRSFDSAVREMLRSAGLVDRDREVARGTLRRASAVALVLTLAGVAAAVALAPLFGPWVVTLPAALLTVTIVFAIAAANFDVWTVPGAQEAERWRAFFTHVAQSVKDASSSALPAGWLPWAVLAGVGAAFAQRTGRPTIPPAWFNAAAGGDSSAAFEAFLTSHAAAGGDGGAAAAGAGGGAAGGGGSGAG